MKSYVAFTSGVAVPVKDNRKLFLKVAGLSAGSIDVWGLVGPSWTLLNLIDVSTPTFAIINGIVDDGSYKVVDVESYSEIKVEFSSNISDTTAVYGVFSTEPDDTMAVAASMIAGIAGNTKENIGGTLARPWGDLNYEQLVREIDSGDAHAEIDVDCSALSMGHFQYQIASTGSKLCATGSFLASELSDCLAAETLWNDFGDISVFQILLNGELTDALASAENFPTILTVWHHSMH